MNSKNFIYDVNQEIKNDDHGFKEYIEITDFSPKQFKISSQYEVKITFRANKNLNIKKISLKLIKPNSYKYDIDINKSLSEDETYIYEESGSIPSIFKGNFEFNLTILDDKGDEIYCATFNGEIMTNINAQLSFTTCGSTDYLEITDFSPKEINPGDSVAEKITVKAKQDIEVTKVGYELQYIGMEIFSQDFDVQIKLPSGELYTQEILGDLPQSIPPGQYNIIAKAYNSEGTELYCANFQIIF